MHVFFFNKKKEERDTQSPKATEKFKLPKHIRIKTEKNTIETTHQKATKSQKQKTARSRWPDQEKMKEHQHRRGPNKAIQPQRRDWVARQ
jgi:hypothetical protein